MPFYEKRCQSCGKKFDALQKFSDEPLTVHPECGGGPVDRLISAPAFQFKGTGWYMNDYAKSDSRKADSGGSKMDSSSSSSSTTTTSAPAATPPSASSTSK